MPWTRALVAVLILTPAALAEDWPQWLGPRRDGSTTEKVAPWKGELKVLWRRPVGEGEGAPVVAGGQVFLLSANRDKEEEMVQSFDARTGKPGWTYSYPRPAFKALFVGRGTGSTPTVAGGRVYTLGATGILTCVDAKSGEKVWQVDTAKEFQPPKLMFGVMGSPLVAGNRVYVNVGAKGASVVAFDKGTGNVIWKKLDDKPSYSSPTLIGPEKDPQVVFLTQKGLVALNADDGTPLWQYPFEDEFKESSTTPMLVGDRLLASSISLGSVLLQLPKAGGIEKTPVKVWENPDLTCYFSTPIPVGKDHIYVVTGTKPKKGLPSLKSTATLWCIDAANGKPLWKRENVGKYHASLLRTGDNKLLMVEEAGSLVLLEPDPKQYRELARATICGETWAHAAVADGLLWIRDKKELVCVQLR